MSTVLQWTGREVRALREARRMSVREFAAHLGVSDRMVSKWEAQRCDLAKRGLGSADFMIMPSPGCPGRPASRQCRCRPRPGRVELHRWRGGFCPHWTVEGGCTPGA